MEFLLDRTPGGAIRPDDAVADDAASTKNNIVRVPGQEQDEVFLQQSQQSQSNPGQRNNLDLGAVAFASPLQRRHCQIQMQLKYY